MRGWLLAGAIALAMLGVQGQAAAKGRWSASWGASPSDVQPGGDIGRGSVRVVVTPHRGGRHLRVRLSNRFGAGPLRVGAASVGRSAGGAAIEPGSIRPLRFGGRRTVTVAAGEERFSDQVNLRFAGFDPLAISVYFRDEPAGVTRHAFSVDRAFATTPDAGDEVDEPAGEPYGREFISWLGVTDLQVRRRSCRAGTIVAFGDSITDGAGSTVDSDRRYPDRLQRRLDRKGSPLTVANAGIAGNSITRDAPFFGGPSGLSRLRRDVLRQPRLRAVLILEGINDLGLGVPAGEVIAGLREMTLRVGRSGAVPVLGTLTPTSRTYGDEQARRRVNRWIRGQRRASVIDFDRELRDPLDRSAIRADLRADYVHPSDAGYRVMARSVPLPLLQRLARCERGGG